jgi:RND family efflux transporter MFP subunit
MKALRTVAVLGLIAAAFAGGYFYKTSRSGAVSQAGAGGRKILYWVDPMHPAYKSDKPGIAPDCGMKLEPVYADSIAGSPAEKSERKILYWVDAMNPAHKSDKPGIAPDGMKLVPVYADDAAASSTMPPGTVQISPEKQQLIGVKFGRAEMGSGTRTFRTIGRVVIDEPRIGRVRAKVGGWVDQVLVDFVGQRVQKDRALMTLNSPELLAAERELLLVARVSGTMQPGALPEAFDQSAALLQAARRRLELWGLTAVQINQVLKTGDPVKTLTLYSPVAGYITDLKAAPGSRVTPEIDLFTVVDTSQVAVLADVFNYDVPDIRVGERARVTLQALPGKAFTAEIEYIQPQADATSPSYKVRLDMGNPGLALKPDMYAEVEFTVEGPAKLVVPADAVLSAGERSVVYVDRGNGFFEPRQVQTGGRDGDSIEILAGLTAGERVVTSGSFLIDSESQLKAAAVKGASKKLATGMGTEGEK